MSLEVRADSILRRHQARDVQGGVQRETESVEAKLSNTARINFNRWRETVSQSGDVPALALHLREENETLVQNIYISVATHRLINKFK